MQTNLTSKSLSSQIQIEFTDKPITGYGGLIILARFFEKVGLRRLLEDALPDNRTSPNALPVADIVISFLVAVAVGASRFAHVQRLRADKVLDYILGLKRIPSATTLTRYFGAFSQGHVEHMTQSLWEWTLKHMPASQKAFTLDMDSSVFTRYGKQEGAKKGYNPRKPGRPSHRPIFAILAEVKIIVNLWLRSGNTSDVSGVNHFFDETMAKLPPHINVRAVRADSGFHDQKFFAYLENKDLHYAVAAKMDKRIQRSIVTAQNWVAVDESHDVTEISYQALSWDRPRRLIAIRERVRPQKNNRGRTLFDITDYTFNSIFTNTDLDPVEVWRFYNGRADSENRLKELKYDFGASGFCLDSFFGTEAALRLIAFLYNLIAIFKSLILKDSKPTLKNIRYQILIVGAMLGSKARKKILRISASGRLKYLLISLIDRLDNYRNPNCNAVDLGT
jgi:uncharacterized membrane protein